MAVSYYSYMYIIGIVIIAHACRGLISQQSAPSIPQPGVKEPLMKGKITIIITYHAVYKVVVAPQTQGWL